MANFLAKFVAILMLLTYAQAGLAAYGICQTGCNVLWGVCVAAVGGVAGVSTGGPGVIAAALPCNAG